MPRLECDEQTVQEGDGRFEPPRLCEGVDAAHVYEIRCGLLYCPA